MKINVGIVGFGNLGKAIEENLKHNEIFNLVKIFSKRKLKNCEHISNLKKYKDKIELLFLCCSSKDSLEQVSFDCIKNFSIVDCYDNHNRLKDYLSTLNAAAQQYQTIALSSFGWDPGIFSLTRGLFDSIGFEPFTFWGKGVSQGHTAAIKNIDGVIDGLQFTIPNNLIIKHIKNGKNFTTKNNFHKRQCFVVCEQKNRQKIKEKIVTMKDYFEGYKTEVNFVSQQELNSLKSFAHRGLVTTKNETLKFSLVTNSNPDITAKIMLAFARAYLVLKQKNMFGAFSIFDLPLNFILTKDKYNYL